MQTKTPALDIWLMVGFDVVGYAFNKIGICLAPFTGVRPLQPCLGCAPVSMIGGGGTGKVFWFVRPGRPHHDSGHSPAVLPILVLPGASDGYGGGH